MMKRGLRIILLLLLAILVTVNSGCSSYPKDPQHTLNQVLARQTMRVGAIDHPPFVSVRDSSVTGVEADIITGFADELGVTVDWQIASSQELFTCLGSRDLDFVIGGINSDNAWRKDVSFSLPFYKNHCYVGAPPSMLVLDYYYYMVWQDCLLQLQRTLSLPMMYICLYVT